MKNDLPLSRAEIDHLLSPAAIRGQAGRLFALTESGRTGFRYHPEKLGPTVDYVLQVIRKNYPDLQIPFHSRWGHFRAGGVNRVSLLNEKIRSLDLKERARTKLDLVITSVLLDAGAGMAWRFREEGKEYSRSEGLGVASFHLFLQGGLGQGKLVADSAGLRALTEETLARAFQVSATNPLVGVAGRRQLLGNLAAAVENPALFAQPRPGALLDLLEKRHGSVIPAAGVLRAVLDALGPIWPGRLSAGGVNLGDVWFHPLLGPEGKAESLIPFHKLSQWMTYSLIEPIQEAGFTVTGVEELTGLAEYRNGGLILDSGLVSLADPSEASRTFAPADPRILEWRALTVHLLDQIGSRVQQALGRSPAEFPLAKVLEGGTWWAGRILAQEKRSDGGPPLKLQSDGTVF